MLKFVDLINFVMCTLVSRVHMTFYILKKGYIVPGNQGTFDKLNQICILSFCSIFPSYCDKFHLKRDKYTVYRDISNSARDIRDTHGLSSPHTATAISLLYLFVYVSARQTKIFQNRLVLFLLSFGSCFWEWSFPVTNFFSIVCSYRI